MLQDVGKGDDFASAGIKPVADNLVVRVVGGGYVVQCSVLFRFFDVQFQQVEAVVDGEVVTGIAQVEGIEAGRVSLRAISISLVCSTWLG